MRAFIEIKPEGRKQMNHEASITMGLTQVGRETESALEGVKADVTLDLRGLSCPLPPLKTVKALKGMQSGEVLEVLGTSPVGKRSAPWLAQRMGNELLAVVEDQDGFYRFFLRKK
jgi:tRNA 2-thiouridine synthesizing protein A